MVIEIKADEFDARDLGQINLYISAVDSNLRRPEDEPTIGLVLCKSKDNYVAEYALRGINRPIGVSSFVVKLVESLPKKLQGQLPSIKEIEEELKKAKTVKTKKISKNKSTKKSKSKKLKS